MYVWCVCVCVCVCVFSLSITCPRNPVRVVRLSRTLCRWPTTFPCCRSSLRRAWSSSHLQGTTMTPIAFNMQRSSLVVSSVMIGTMTTLASKKGEMDYSNPCWSFYSLLIFLQVSLSQFILLCLFPSVSPHSEPDKARARKWIRRHSISFTFVGSEFLPNPDFEWP